MNPCVTIAMRVMNTHACKHLKTCDVGSNVHVRMAPIIALSGPVYALYNLLSHGQPINSYRIDSAS